MLQIRVSCTKGLECLFWDLGNSIAGACPEAKLDLNATAHRVGRLISRALAVGELCGCSNLCDEATTPFREDGDYDSFMLSTAPPWRDRIERWRFGVPASGIQAFCRWVVFSVLDEKAVRGASDSEGAVGRFVDVLTLHIFISPLCGTLDFCKSGNGFSVPKGPL